MVYGHTNKKNLSEFDKLSTASVITLFNQDLIISFVQKRKKIYSIFVSFEKSEISFK